MTTSRRQLLRSAAAMSLASWALPIAGAGAQTAPRPPVIFVHGNGDHAALWLTTLWRFEVNSWPRDHLIAFNFTDPLSRNDDTVPMSGRSGTEDQLKELTAIVRAALARTGAPRVALVGSSRGGNAIRKFFAEQGGGAQVSHAILCGTPNRGVFDWEFNPGSEFNGRAPFLRRLNGRDTDVGSVDGPAITRRREYAPSGPARYGADRPGTRRAVRPRRRRRAPAAGRGLRWRGSRGAG